MSRLRTARKKARLTTRELGHFAECSHTTILRLEKGEIDVSAPLKVRIARALGVPVSEVWPKNGQ